MWSFNIVAILVFTILLNIKGTPLDKMIPIFSRQLAKVTLTSRQLSFFSFFILKSVLGYVRKVMIVKHLSQFRWSHHWAVTLRCRPCLLHLLMQNLKGHFKEPICSSQRVGDTVPCCSVSCTTSHDWEGEIGWWTNQQSLESLKRDSWWPGWAYREWWWWYRCKG